MALSAHTYTKAGNTLASKLANLGSDSIKVMLLSAYTPAVDAHQFVSDVLAAGTETSGTGYTAGGQALTSVSLSNAGHIVTLNAANASWGASTISASYAVFYDSTPGSNATNPVLAYWDFGGAQASSGGAFTLTLTSGVLTITGSG